MSERYLQALRKATPGAVLKWASALFVIALYICFIIAVVLSLAGVYT